MMQHTKTLRALLLATVTLTMPSQVFAQEATDAAAADDGVITVTARKIEESVQEAPLAIAAYSGEVLAERGIEDLTEIARSTPGFTFENFNGGFATPTIRGQSQTRLTNPVQNVATFFNGVYLQRGYMIDQSMLNIGQVEILRGPQSAALGRNAYAGAINFHSKEPGNEYHATFVGSYGENKYHRLDASVEGPIIKDVLSVIAGISDGSYDGGWANVHPLANAAGARTSGNLGGYDYRTWHIGGKFTPTDTITIKANYINNDRDVENPAQYTIGTASFDNRVNTNNCSQATLGTGATAVTFNSLFCGVVPVEPTLAAGENRPAGLIVDPRAGLKLKSEVFSADAEIELSDAISVNYVFGHANASFNGAGSAARNPIIGLTGVYNGENLIDTTGNGSITSDSHELRLTYAGDNGFTAYVGGYLGDTKDRTQFALVRVPAQSSGTLNPGTVMSGPGLAGNSQTQYKISSVFGFAEYKAGAFALSLEGRYTEEKMTESDFVAATSAQKKFKYFTPRVTASVELSDTNRIYASFAQGVKAGGFNTGGSNPAAFYDPTQATYGTERNDTFELGSRNEFLDGDLILNATAYYINARNVQVGRVRTQPPGSTVFQTVIGNLGKTNTLGFELETTYKVSDAIKVFAGAGYNNAKYGDGVIDSNIVSGKLCDNVVCASNGVIGGNRLERNPRINLNAGFNFDQDLNDDWGVFLNGNISHQGSQFINNTNTAQIAARTIVDASIGARYKFAEFKISADNLFDNKYVSSAFALAGGSSPFFYQRQIIPNLGNRRRIAGTLTIKF